MLIPELGFGSGISKNLSEGFNLKNFIVSRLTIL